MRKPRNTRKTFTLFFSQDFSQKIKTCLTAKVAESAEEVKTKSLPQGLFESTQRLPVENRQNKPSWPGWPDRPRSNAEETQFKGLFTLDLQAKDESFPCSAIKIQSNV